jgi:hypothetical protein
MPRYGDATMVVTRTQITLDGEAHRRAKERAGELGVSLAEYVRRLVDADLAAAEPPKTDISAIFGLFDSGGSDIARFKDQYLGEAAEKLHPRR